MNPLLRSKTQRESTTGASGLWNMAEIAAVHGVLPPNFHTRPPPPGSEEFDQIFHPYLMKYLVMICRGHVPTWGHNQAQNKINRDVEPFIRYFLPRGSPMNRMTIGKVVKHFHLAF